MPNIITIVLQYRLGTYIFELENLLVHEQDSNPRTIWSTVEVYSHKANTDVQQNTCLLKSHAILAQLLPLRRSSVEGLRRLLSRLSTNAGLIPRFVLK